MEICCQPTQRGCSLVCDGKGSLGGSEAISSLYHQLSPQRAASCLQYLFLNVGEGLSINLVIPETRLRYYFRLRKYNLKVNIMVKEKLSAIIFSRVEIGKLQHLQFV